MRRWFLPGGRFTWILLAILFGLDPAVWLGAEAQTVLVKRNVNLRRDPSTSQTPYRLLLPPEELVLRDTAKTNNYYHVYRAESDEDGWVWANNVQVIFGEIVEPLADTTAADAIDPAWPKPSPVVATFHSPVQNLSCGPVGDGGDTATNRLKNRIDIPPSYRAVSFDAVGDLEYPATTSTSRLTWPAESLAVILRFEGVPVQLSGYLVALKPQTGGSGESTNCHMTRSAEVDWHMALAEQAGQGEADAIVVEPTPRIRVNHPKWTVARIQPWLDSSDPVRISGWLLFDPSHRNHLGHFRKTLWEIHPITKIEVWRDEAWVDVDNLPRT